MEILLECRHVSKSYMNPSGEGETQVLRDVSLTVEKGEAVAITGPSGSGKSTLLNILGGLDKPSSGSVLFSGTDLSPQSDAELSRMRSREIGFVFQMHYLLPQCTVFENVLIPILPLKLSREKDKEARDRAVRLLDRVGLGGHTHHFPAMLSGGEMQRAAVVRALINRPKVVLADEPTGSLDRDSSDQLGKLLVTLNREEETTLIVVTHSMALAGLMEKRYGLLNGILEQL
jgi:lipoprotein-releasing system ATP-binding protein